MVKEFKRVSPTAEYTQRVKKIKALLPKNYKEILFANYPEYNTAKGAILIQNVVAQRSADIVVTEILERIASGELKLKQ